MKKTKRMLELEARINEDLGVFLRREYAEKVKSTVQIARKLKTSNNTIWRWLKKFFSSASLIESGVLLKAFSSSIIS